MMLVTDLDNTLYDWVTYYAQSFEAMLRELSVVLDVPESLLLAEFKQIHQTYGNSEQPLALLDLPSVSRKYDQKPRSELLRNLARPLKAFQHAEQTYLRLYEGVEQTLRILAEHDITIIGHTEAILVNAYYRLKVLGIDKYFSRLYTTEGQYGSESDIELLGHSQPPLGLTRIVPRSERKPNPELLLDICASEGKQPWETWYVGDSIVRDISMARDAKVRSVWARYGTQYDRRHWSILVAITHWTEEDVAKEERLREMYREVQPDYIIDSFSQLLEFIPFNTGTSDTQTE
jgi:phosphoglycolate phosphatase-like HAD superfamily hydrolase